VTSAAELDEPDPAALSAFRRDLARLLNNLTYWPTGQGRREEAPTAAEEAIIIRQELAASWPDAHRDKLERPLRLVVDLRDEDASDAPRGSLTQVVLGEQLGVLRSQ